MALADGPRSTIWTELRPAIPSVTFARLTSYAGVEAKVTASWEDLCQAFNSDLELKLKTGERSKQTVENYEGTLSRFGAFLAERHITRLHDINRSVIDEFSSCRIDQVKSPQSLGGQPSLYFDLSHLHRVGAFACERDLLEKNPFPTPKRPPLKRQNGLFVSSRLTTVNPVHFVSVGSFCVTPVSQNRNRPDSVC
jgi:integrase family protein with SAM-like domain